MRWSISSMLPIAGVVLLAAISGATAMWVLSLTLSTLHLSDMISAGLVVMMTGVLAAIPLLLIFGWKRAVKSTAWIAIPVALVSVIVWVLLFDYLVAAQISHFPFSKEYSERDVVLAAVEATCGGMYALGIGIVAFGSIGSRQSEKSAARYTAFSVASALSIALIALLCVMPLA